MDKENVVRVYNGVLPSFKKQWCHEMCKQMDGTKRNPSEWGNPDAERLTGYVLTCK